MQNLISEIAELERLYRLNKRKLIYIKLFVILNGILALIYAFGKTLKYPSVKKLSELTFFEAKCVITLFVLVPLILTPLFKFFTDRIANKINWDIKMSIFSDVLNKYNVNFNVSFKGILPDSDLKFLKFDNGITKFAYGDDLIFGKLNTTNFRLCELHSINFIGKSFHGLVGVLILNDNASIETIESHFSTNTNFNIKYFNGKVFLLKSYKSEMFEFSIRNDQVNKSKLIDDYNFFDKFVCELNELSLKLT